MEQQLIILKQAPVIDYTGLSEIGEFLDKRLKALDVDNMIATPESLKSLKELRASLNNEFKSYEEGRKVVKNGVNKPYLDFEAEYKSNITTKYSANDVKLKDKILFVEKGLKDLKTNDLKLFFDESCIASEIDFLSFESVGLNIILSATVKSLKDKITTFISKVVNEVAIINTLAHSEDYRADVLVEYRKDLDLKIALETIERRYEEKKSIIKEQPKQEPIASIDPSPVVEAKKDQPLKKPIVEDVYTAKFEVKGTEQQLLKLNEYLKENNLFYTNI